MEKCKHCNREKPGYGVDTTCAKGGQCEWVSEPTLPNFIRAIAKTTDMNVSWAEGNGIDGRRMSWGFPGTAIVEGLEIESKSYEGYIGSLQVGLADFMHLGPYPISMWSPGKPPVNLWLPSVKLGNHFAITVYGFHGRIRPRGLILEP